MLVAGLNVNFHFSGDYFSCTSAEPLLYINIPPQGREMLIHQLLVKDTYNLQPAVNITIQVFWHLMHPSITYVYIFVNHFAHITLPLKDKE